MNSIESFGTLDQINIEGISISAKEKIESFNKAFHSKVAPKSGVYGITEVAKSCSIIEKLGINESGNCFKEYYDSYGRIMKSSISSVHGIENTYFDDNGLAYLTKTTKFDNNQVPLTANVKLAFNATIVKDNFTAVTDEFGRTVLAKVTDLELKDGVRENLNKIYKTNEYRASDQKGHLIPDSFNGPASEENIVAQLDKVNAGKIKQVENIARDLKKQGKTVDYEVKANYTGSGKRPSSFEIEIKSDGEKYVLPDELKKIYNEAPDELTSVKKFQINAGEKLGLANELGVKSGLVAGGLTMAVSSYENISAYLDGEITSEKMVEDIVEDTVTAGALGYGTTFVSTAASQLMSKSSSALISKVGQSCAPAAVVAFAVESYDDVSDYVKGEIDGKELAYNLGENAAGVAGGFAGGALAGAALGSVLGPAGTVVGGVVGGVVGTVLATEAYHVAVEACSEEAEVLADKAKELSVEVVTNVASVAPEVVNDVKEAFAEYSAVLKLPFTLGQ